MLWIHITGFCVLFSCCLFYCFVGFQEMGRVVFSWWFQALWWWQSCFPLLFLPSSWSSDGRFEIHKMGFPVFVFLLSFLLFCRISGNMSCGFQLMVLSSPMMTILLSFLKETVVLMFGINRLGRMGMLVWCGMHSHQLECAWTIWTLWKVRLVMHWWCCNLEEKAQLS